MVDKKNDGLLCTKKNVNTYFQRDTKNSVRMRVEDLTET